MTSINISIPESLRAYVESQIEHGDWATPAEYIRDLIRQDRERRLALLEETLLEGLASPAHEVRAADLRSNRLLDLLREKIQP